MVIVRIVSILLILSSVSFAQDFLSASFFQAWKAFDFTTGTETDDGAGDITINSDTLVTVSTMRRDATGYVVADKNIGVDDVRFRFKVNVSALTANGAQVAFVMLSDDAGTIQDANGSKIQP